jgi:GTP cyclohydrolase I
MLPDVQATRMDRIEETLSWVGMEQIDLPVEIGGRPLSAKVSAGINLLSSPAAEKGIHMSRLYLLLDELTQEELTPALLKRVMQSFLDSHKGKSDEATISVAGDLLLSRKSLTSNQFGWKGYPIHIQAELNNTFSVTLKAGIPYSSTCPASTALSRQVSSLQFRNDFAGRPDILTVEDVVSWLSDKGMPATPHSQRSWAWVTVRLATDTEELPVVDLIDAAELALGTAVQTVVKRSDEQAFAIANGQNLMFCEDAARKLYNSLEASPAWEDMNIHVEHQESLHAHNAVARIKWKRNKDVA